MSNVDCLPLSKMAFVVILLAAFSLLNVVPTQSAEETCELNPTTGEDVFAFEPTELADGEFHVSFKVMANKEFKIALSQEQAISESSSYIIAIGVDNVATTIRRKGGAVIKTETRKAADGSVIQEFQCSDYAMSGYWMCFKDNTLKLGRSDEQYSYFDYTFPVQDKIDANYFGYATGGSNVALFGAFEYTPTCPVRKPSPGFSDADDTEEPPIRCRPVDCDLQCAWGYASGQDGCKTCDCRDSPCDPLMCQLVCQHGLQRNDQGCEICECLQGPCDNEPCQNSGYCFGMGADNYQCVCPEGFEGKHCTDDVGNPVVTCPPPKTVTTDKDKPTASVPETPTVTDNFDPQPSVTCSPKLTDLPVGVNVIKCIATDASGNTGSGTYNVTVEDKQIPDVEFPVSTELTTDTGKPVATQVFTTPSAKDNADPSPSVVCTPNDQTQFTCGVTSVTCTATDKYGNENVGTFEITVHDTEPPVFTAEPTITKNSDDGKTTTTVDYEKPVATDNVDGELPVTCTPEPGSVFNIGKTDITCTATDSADNELTTTTIVTVKDASPPEITCPDSKIVGMDPGKKTSIVDYTVPSATDNSGQNPPTFCSPAPGSVFPAGTTQVTCNAEDESGNKCNCKFDVEVKDEEKPVLKYQQKIAFVTDEGKSFSTIQFPLPDVTDNFDDELTVTCQPQPGDTIEAGEQTMSCKATDTAGNKAECSIEITVTDNQPPSFVCPETMTDIAMDDGKNIATLTYTTPEATDNLDANPVVDCNPKSGTAIMNGENSIVCSSMDAAGNNFACTFHATVKDDQRPVFTTFPEDKTVPMDFDKSTTTLTFDTPTAEDNLTPDPTVICSPVYGTVLQEGETVVTCTAQDTSKNTETQTFTVTVTDKQGPSIEVPMDMTEPIDKGFNHATVDFEATVTDNADPNPTYECDPPSGTKFALGENTVTCTAKDKNGNTNAGVFNIVVEDNKRPTIKCPVSMIKPTEPGTAQATVDFPEPEASDNSGKKPSLECEPSAGSVFDVGNSTVSCTAKDDTGNANTCDFHVIVQDKENPKFDTTPADVVTPTDLGIPTTIVNFDKPTATDNVDPDVNVACKPASGSRLRIGQHTVICSAKDDYENTEVVSFKVEVKDEEKPVMICPKDVEPFKVGIGESTAMVFYDKATATDNSGSTDPVKCVPIPGSVFEIGSTTINCSSSDAAGNCHSCLFHIQVQDDQKPSLTCPAAKTMPMEEGQSYASADYTLPVGTDNSKTVVRVNCSPINGAELPKGDNDVICTATDKFGNKETCNFKVTVEDKEPPKFTSPSPAPEGRTEPGSNLATVTYDTPTARDNVDEEVTPTCQPASGSKFPVGESTVVCSVVDSVGNKKQTSFVVKVTDANPPDITCPVPMDNIFAQTDSDQAKVNYKAPTVTDAVDPNPVVTCDPPSETQFKIGKWPVVCTATDSANNAATCSFEITVKDNQIPSVETPEDKTLPMVTGEKYAVAEYELPTASDNSDEPVDVECTPSNEDKLSLLENTVVCTATDKSNNKNTCSFKIFVKDEEDPTITCPTTIRKNTNVNSNVAKVDFPSPTASDIADPNPTVSCNPPTGSDFPMGKSSVTCTATDNVGNSCDCTFEVEVGDKENPKMTLPPSSTMPADEGKTTKTFRFDTPVATDNVDQAPTVTCTPAPDAPIEIPIGEQIVACTATDTAGNQNTGQFKVTVEDKVPPTLTFPTDLSKPADEGKAVATFPYEVTAEDLADPNPVVKCSRESGEFTVGETLVTCSATDKSGNTATDSFTISVTDEQPPVFTIPQDISKSTDVETNSTKVFFEKPSGTDNVDGYVDVQCSPESGSRFEVGETTITCTASDKDGNSKSNTFTVTVIDNRPPIMDSPAPVTVTLEKGESTAPVPFPTPIAKDNVQGEFPAVCDPSSGSTFSVGKTQVTCGASDKSDNENFVTFDVTVQDKEAPEFTTPESITKSLDEGTSSITVTFTQPTGNDNVDGDVEVKCTKPSESTFNAGIHPITCTATDSSENTKTDTFSVTVKDEESPQMTCPKSKLMEFAVGETTGTIEYTLPTATDNVDGDVAASCKPESGSTLAAGNDYEITCTATDSSNNVGKCNFKITVSAPCEFVTQIMGLNMYPTCVKPLKKNGEKLCMKLEKPEMYDMFMSIWDQESGQAYQQGMIDLAIAHNMLTADFTAGAQSEHASILAPHFNDATGEVCIMRTAAGTEITTVGGGKKVFPYPDDIEWEETTIGFASSMSGDWVAKRAEEADGN